MPLNQIIGLGCQFHVDKSSTGTFVQVKGLLSSDGPSPSGASIDTSVLDSTINFETSQGGLVNAGQVTLSFAYDSDDPGQKDMAGLLGTRNLATFKTVFPTTMPDETFLGTVDGGGRAISKGSMVTRPFTIGVSGEPGWAATT